MLKLVILTLVKLYCFMIVLMLKEGGLSVLYSSPFWVCNSRINIFPSGKKQYKKNLTLI